MTNLEMALLLAIYAAFTSTILLIDTVRTNIKRRRIAQSLWEAQQRRTGKKTSRR
jgi:hypothetical protein